MSGRHCSSVSDSSASGCQHLAPYVGPLVGVAFDNAVLGCLQTELLDTRKWRARTELSTEIFDWIEIRLFVMKRGEPVTTRSSAWA